MIKKAKVGDRVRVTEKRYWNESKSFKDGELVGFWPKSAKTGVVVSVWGNSRRYINVHPDDPLGVGSVSFRPSELERIKDGQGE